MSVKTEFQSSFSTTDESKSEENLPEAVARVGAHCNNDVEKGLEEEYSSNGESPDDGVALKSVVPPLQASCAARYVQMDQVFEGKPAPVAANVAISSANHGSFDSEPTSVADYDGVSPSENDTKKHNTKENTPGHTNFSMNKSRFNHITLLSPTMELKNKKSGNRNNPQELMKQIIMNQMAINLMQQAVQANANVSGAVFSNNLNPNAFSVHGLPHSSIDGPAPVSYLPQPTPPPPPTQQAHGTIGTYQVRMNIERVPRRLVNKDTPPPPPMFVSAGLSLENKTSSNGASGASYNQHDLPQVEEEDMQLGDESTEWNSKRVCPYFASSVNTASLVHDTDGDEKTILEESQDQFQYQPTIKHAKDVPSISTMDSTSTVPITAKLGGNIVVKTPDFNKSEEKSVSSDYESTSPESRTKI